MNNAAGTPKCKRDQEDRCDPNDWLCERLSLTAPPISKKSGGPKGATQRWLRVYPSDFEIPTFFVAFD